MTALLRYVVGCLIMGIGIAMATIAFDMQMDKVWVRLLVGGIGILVLGFGMMIVYRQHRRLRDRSPRQSAR